MIEHTLGDVLFTLDDVGLILDEKVILRNVSAKVRDLHRPGMNQGQVVGILGPSGIGKTQLSSIISGMQPPTSGSVSLENGVDPEGHVGFVFQDYPLFDHRTVMGNLLVAATCSRKEALDKANGFLDMFRLSDKADMFPIQLSGGQRQRVAIVQQLMRSEHYLVMDEPFTGLDPIMKDKTCELITKVATLDEKNTIFIVAHDISALVTVSDCLWLLGREKDAAGVSIPGATIVEKYNLVERGLAWHPELFGSVQFQNFVAEVKDRFRTLP